MRRDRTGFAEHSGKPAVSPRGPVAAAQKCVECGSDELVALNGRLANFFVACAVCGRVRRKDPAAHLDWFTRFASRAWLILNSIAWTVVLSVLWPLALMLFVSFGYLFVWAVWNFVLVPLAGTETFSILEFSNFLRWWLPSFFVSILLLIAAVRYLPERILPSFFRDSSFRKRP
jgi:hypothetical protein